MASSELNPGLPLRQIIIWALCWRNELQPDCVCPDTRVVDAFCEAGISFARHNLHLGSAMSGTSRKKAARSTRLHFLSNYRCAFLETTIAGRVFDPFMGSGTTGVACVRFG